MQIEKLLMETILKAKAPFLFLANFWIAINIAIKQPEGLEV